VSAVFHYLGPSFAVLLFARVDVLGVAWLRIASAAAILAVWRRPWRFVRRLDRRARWALVLLGSVLAAMNTIFYLAIDRLPLATVGAIEFLGTVLLAALGTRTWRNAAALGLTTIGVAAITTVRITGEPWGFVLAFTNCALFMLYVVLGHQIANADLPRAGSRDRPVDGIDRLSAAMVVAALVVTPIGLVGALATLRQPELILAGAGVGVCSSVVPYVADQLAMARLPRASFALMLALLPMLATIIGAVMLRQLPTARDLLGIALVVAGVALHRATPQQPRGGARAR
jgi:inner membrane transporter RhtA